jgi:predicted transposase YbfD/YdcC
MHWLLDVEFKDDLSRYRSGHGAKNMAIGRRFALGLVGANTSKSCPSPGPKPPLPTACKRRR